MISSREVEMEAMCAKRRPIDGVGCWLWWYCICAVMWWKRGSYGWLMSARLTASR